MTEIPDPNVILVTGGCGLIGPKLVIQQERMKNGLTPFSTPPFHRKK
jgi:hypothetical protein